jgi:hypothetical protein
MIGFIINDCRRSAQPYSVVSKWKPPADTNIVPNRIIGEEIVQTRTRNENLLANTDVTEHEATVQYLPPLL